MRPEKRRADQTLRSVILLLMAAAVLTGFTRPERAAGEEDARRPPELVPIEMYGVASWYGEWFRGRTTACGEAYDPDALTAAHRDLPCGTRVRVEHGGRSVTVTITDRGPYVEGRFLDLSRAAFARLAPLDQGLAEVRAVLVTVR